MDPSPRRRVLGKRPSRGGTEDPPAPADQPTTPAPAEESQLSSQGSFTFHHVFTRDNPGKLDDFYDVDPEKLGEGSFGSAFRAKCKRTGQDRAVKNIEIKRVKNVEKFELEIGIASKLNHPNVVRLFETFRDAKKIYLVMELCTGGELFDRIVSDAPSGFDETSAAQYVRQMLASLCYLHAQGFAHRDIKPENFLLGSPDKDAPLKLIDFGMACRIVSDEKMTTKAGTPYYVAPEVLKGSYNEKCDIWSAGVLTFILLCGFPPFAGNSDPQILKKVRAGKVVFKSPEWDDISAGAKDITSQMLTMDYAERPSAEALLAVKWLQSKGTPKPAAIKGDFLKRLQGFQAHSRLKKVALTVVAQQLPDSELDGLKEIFRTLDKNGDGLLTSAEVREGMEKQGLTVPKALAEILQNVDSDGSGELDYTEFLAATVDQKLYMQRDVCWAAFRIFDLDGDGKITREELSTVLSGDGVKTTLGAHKVAKMIEEADVDGDGCIDFEEFCQMMGPGGSPAKKRQKT